MSRLQHAIYEVRRLLVPIVLLGIATYMLDVYGVQDQWALRMHKINQVMFYTVLAHMIRSQVWPYVDLKTMIEQRDPSTIGVAIMQGLFMTAIILGGTLGL